MSRYESHNPGNIIDKQAALINMKMDKEYVAAMDSMIADFKHYNISLRDFVNFCYGDEIADEKALKNAIDLVNEHSQNHNTRELFIYLNQHVACGVDVKLL